MRTRFDRDAPDAVAQNGHWTPAMHLLNAAKRPLRRWFQKLGYDVHKVQVGNVGGVSLYEVVRPFATYSPWNKDELFKQTDQAIRTHTKVDPYRCFELWSLVGQTAKLSGALIEIGVWRGGTGALIARKAAICGMTEPVYLCDTFEGVVKASEKDSLYQGGEHADTSQETVQALLDGFGLKNARILKGIFPDESARHIEGQTFKFCHIDVDVYQSAQDIVHWIWPKMCVGGVIVYDDYGFFGCDGITRHVEEQLPCTDRMIIHNLNGHAVVVKVK